MFQAVQFPTCVANLHSSLAHMDGDTLTLEHTNTSYVTAALPTKNSELTLIFMNMLHQNQNPGN
jgi:hypothetical protein